MPVYIQPWPMREGNKTKSLLKYSLEEQASERARERERERQRQRQRESNVLHKHKYLSTGRLFFLFFFTNLSHRERITLTDEGTEGHTKSALIKRREVKESGLRISTLS